MQRREIRKRGWGLCRVKARVMKRRSAAKAKVLNVVQMFRGQVWAVLAEVGAGVVVESKVQIGMRDVGVLGRVGIWGEMRERAAFRKRAIIHRVVNR